MIDFVYSF